MSHPFSGNIRELRNVMERAALFCDGDVIELSHIEQALTADAWGPGADSPSASATTTLSSDHRRTMTDASLLQAAQAHRLSRAELAASLGVSERTLYRRLQDLKMTQKPDESR